MNERIAQSRFFGRLFDIFIPLLAWSTITMPLWLSPFHPALVAYFIIAFDLYFFYKSIKTSYFAVLSYKTILDLKNFPFRKKIIEISQAKELTHFVIIPNYKEPIHKLLATIQSIADCDYPYEKINLVLAFEDREKEASQKAKQIKTQFKDYFQSITESYHTLATGEVVGKASNQAYAARQLDKYALTKKLKRENVLITIADADSSFPKNFFSYLSYAFARDKGRLYHFYWAPVLLYNNFWQLPFFVRMQATMSSILRLAFLSETEKLIQISTYSTSLWLLKAVNFWDVDIIPEDWHIYFQAFFKFGNKVKTIPLYTIVNGDAVYSGATLKTLKNRYEQERRWAWGASDISYSLKRSFDSPHIDFLTKFKKIFFLMETHLLWPVSFFILTVSAYIPPLIHPPFKRTVLGFLLPKLTSLILTLSSLFILLYIYLDIKLRQKVRQKIKLRNLPLLFIQWYLLPVVSFILSSLPALDAHTRMMFGKKLEYKVTEKV